jgi:hypothetical protein
VDFASNFGEFGAQQVLDFPASMSTTVSQIEKLLDFLQGEPESLHLLDKSESCYVISGKEPEVPLGSGCSWQQRPALVEADRIDAKIRLLCGFTNLDCAAGTFQSVWHKKIIHSGLYSRVNSAFAGGEVELGAFPIFPNPRFSPRESPQNRGQRFTSRSIQKIDLYKSAWDRRQGALPMIMHSI